MMATITFFGFSTGRGSVGGFDGEADSRGARAVEDAGTFDGVHQFGFHDDRDVAALEAGVVIAWLVLKGKRPAVDSTMRPARDADADGGFGLGLPVKGFLELLGCFWRDREQGDLRIRKVA
jgi:hypothetical protein